MIQTHRETCFQEYSEECQICGNDENIDVHHRDGDRTNNNIENLIPLCHSCHKQIHNKNKISELASELIGDLSKGCEPDIDPRQYDGVPNRASVTAKETWKDNYYYYFVWRDGDDTLWEYIGPVDEYKTGLSTDGHQQSSLNSFTTSD